MHLTTPETRIKELIAEKDRRDCEALRCYRPLPSQIPFHKSLSPERVVRGGNRSGKTVSASVEFASAVTRVPITGPDDRPLPFNYPERPILAWVIGYDQRHIGQTLYRVLFEPGLFQVIRDEVSGQWRFFRPWDKDDVARQKDAKPAEPLIPPRLIDHSGWGWEDKANGVFTQCRLKNGTKICAYPSTGAVKMGDPVDLIWIDEDIRFAGHVAEWQARLSDRKGRLIWSAFPYSKNNALVRLSDRAQKDRENKNKTKKDIEEIVLIYSHNPFIDEEQKRLRHEAWTDEEIRARDYGEFLYDTILMYDFSLLKNGIVETEDPFNLIYTANGNMFPRDWTRYFILDPGHTNTAGLFAVVPPEKLTLPNGKSIEIPYTVIIEDEIYLKNATAEDTAAEVLQKVTGLRYEAFICDDHAGRQTPMGFGKTVKQQYADAFARARITSRQTGSTFLSGSDNTSARREVVRSWLRKDTETGHVILRVLPHKTLSMQWEFKNYKRRITGENIMKDEPAPGYDHLMHTLEYLAAYTPRFVSPENYPAEPSPIYKLYQDLLKNGSKQDSQDYVHFGPGRSTSLT